MIITSQQIAVGSVLKYNGGSYPLPARISDMANGTHEVLVEDGDGWRKVTIEVVINPTATINQVKLDPFLD